MSLSFILRSAQRSLSSCVLPAIRTLGGSQVAAAKKNFHSVSKNCPKTEPTLLRTWSPLINAICGMKTKGKLNLRCKSCYFVIRQGRRYVMCKTHPRHKQQAMIKKPEHTWIMTHFTNGKRAWPRW